jgi:DNA phosphorothioation-dependent restriction protein DptG
MTDSDNTEYEPYDVKDAVTEVDNYFFTFEFLEYYKSTIQGISANFYHITNNVDLPTNELEELKILVEEAEKTYESFRLKEKVLSTEKDAEEYAAHLGNVFKLTDEIAG